MNYVDLSGIYRIWDVVYVFCEITVNPPSLLILSSNRRSSFSFVAFKEGGGLVMRSYKILVLLR